MGNNISTSKIRSDFVLKSKNFNTLLDILADAYYVSLYYSELLLQDSLPISLEHYKNYSKLTDVYFSKTKDQKIEDIDMSYHDFYTQLTCLNYMYEATVNNDDMRRNIISQVFDKSYKIQKHLVQDIYNYYH